MSAVEAAAAPARPSVSIRDPLADHLLTPQNSAFMIIDYQPRQVAGVRSMDADLLIRNAVSTLKLARLFGLPIVHSTVNVASGNNAPTIVQLAPLLDGFAPIDRTTINAWEDERFLAAVRATGRRKLVVCALWTEMCLAFPTLDALREGYGVYPVVDAIGGTSSEAHRVAMDRVVQAGVQPITWASLAGELQRDWARVETVPQLIELAINERPPNERL